ncbi:ankyrin repeat domain-containing protein [Niallia taxi]|uniref:ankyrin repeat domain-containing protein n=1 Tax=Niallia taxi TaxID=2499688 RepID=UPI0015F48F6A|nr:ankyrin repeat domain-containing protein [Niallia taxi]
MNKLLRNFLIVIPLAVVIIFIKNTFFGSPEEVLTEEQSSNMDNQLQSAFNDSQNEETESLDMADDETAQAVVDETETEGISTTDSPKVNYTEEDVLKAILTGDEASLLSYLNNGLDTELVISSSTILTWAIDQQQYGIMQVLLENNADPNGISEVNNITPLMAAVITNNKQAVEILLSFDADPDIASDGVLPVELAASQGYNDLVPLLMK